MHNHGGIYHKYFFFIMLCMRISSIMVRKHRTGDTALMRWRSVRIIGHHEKIYSLGLTFIEKHSCVFCDTVTITKLFIFII